MDRRLPRRGRTVAGANVSPGKHSSAAAPQQKLDGTPVRDAADLQLRLALLRIGEVTEFAVSRPGGASRWRNARRPRAPNAPRKAHQKKPHGPFTTQETNTMGRPAALLKTPWTR